MAALSAEALRYGAPLEEGEMSTASKTPWRVWGITDHPCHDSKAESFATKDQATTRGAELSSNGDGWLIGKFDGYGDDDWAAYKVQAIAFNGEVFTKR